MTEQTFAAWLANEIADEEMLKRDFAKEAGISASMLSSILSGTRKAGPKTLVGIARALCYPPEFVFEKAGLLPPNGLSAIKRELIRLIPDLPDEDVRTLIELAPPSPCESCPARHCTT